MRYLSQSIFHCTRSRGLHSGRQDGIACLHDGRSCTCRAGRVSQATCGSPGLAPRKQAASGALGWADGGGGTVRGGSEGWRRWWYALGCLVGASGALGAVSALRHRAGVDLIRPAKVGRLRDSAEEPWFCDRHTRSVPRLEAGSFTRSHSSRAAPDAGGRCGGRAGRPVSGGTHRWAFLLLSCMPAVTQPPEPRRAVDTARSGAGAVWNGSTQAAADGTRTWCHPAGLISAAATALVVIALCSVRCKYIPGHDCARLRVM